MPDPNFATNLRRLLLFEHMTAKEAADAMGATQATVSRWLTGKRYPSAEALIKIETLYGVSPRELDSDPVEFAQALADADRIAYAQAARSSEGGVNISLKALRDEARKREAEKVVPLRRKS